jgi:hypothetical protein
MSEQFIISLIVGFTVPIVFAGAGMIVSAHVAERAHDRRFIYMGPAICASIPALILVLALGPEAMGGVAGALIVCSLVWRAYCAERKRGEKRSGIP